MAAGTEELLDLVLRIESMLALGVVRSELLVARLCGGRRLDPRLFAASCSGGSRSGMYWANFLLRGSSPGPARARSVRRPRSVPTPPGPCKDVRKAFCDWPFGFETVLEDLVRDAAVRWRGTDDCRIGELFNDSDVGLESWATAC